MQEKNFSINLRTRLGHFVYAALGSIADFDFWIYVRTLQSLKPVRVESVGFPFQLVAHEFLYTIKMMKNHKEFFPQVFSICLRFEELIHIFRVMYMHSRMLNHLPFSGYLCSSFFPHLHLLMRRCRYRMYYIVQQSWQSSSVNTWVTKYLAKKFAYIEIT